jgi:hypothetical protein
MESKFSSWRNTAEHYAIDGHADIYIDTFASNDIVDGNEFENLIRSLLPKGSFSLQYERLHFAHYFVPFFLDFTKFLKFAL